MVHCESNTGHHNTAAYICLKWCIIISILEIYYPRPPPQNCPQANYCELIIIVELNSNIHNSLITVSGWALFILLFMPSFMWKRAPDSVYQILTPPPPPSPFVLKRDRKLDVSISRTRGLEEQLISEVGGCWPPRFPSNALKVQLAWNWMRDLQLRVSACNAPQPFSALAVRAEFKERKMQ